MTGTFSFQAIAVAPRGKRAMELLNITVGALAQLIRAARDPQHAMFEPEPTMK